MIISPHRCSWSLYSHAANRWCWPLHSAYGEQTARCAFAPSCPWRAKCKECIITRLEIWTVFSEVFKISTENWLEDHTIVRLIQLCQVAFFFLEQVAFFYSTVCYSFLCLCLGPALSSTFGSRNEQLKNEVWFSIFYAKEVWFSSDDMSSQQVVHTRHWQLWLSLCLGAPNIALQSNLLCHHYVTRIGAGKEKSGVI